MLRILNMIARRLAIGVFTLAVVSLVIFLAVSFLPGDIATQILGQSAEPETVQQLRRELGVNQPLHTRYLEWIGGVIQGDLGSSLSTGQPVKEVISARLGNTLLLAGLAAAAAVPLALVLGIVAALWRDSAVDRAINASALTAISFPEFFVGYVLIFVFAVNLGWFPTMAGVETDAGIVDRLHSLALPIVTLMFVVVAHSMRMTRASIIGLLNEPYIEMAELKGLSPTRVFVAHALPNAIAPIANVVALNLAYLIVGVVAVEVVFVYPGLGQLMVDAVQTRDITVVQACSLVFAGTYVLLNLSADVISTLSNPRLLHPK